MQRRVLGSLGRSSAAQAVDAPAGPAPATATREAGQQDTHRLAHTPVHTHKLTRSRLNAHEHVRAQRTHRHTCAQSHKLCALPPCTRRRAAGSLPTPTLCRVPLRALGAPARPPPCGAPPRAGRTCTSLTFPALAAPPRPAWGLGPRATRTWAHLTVRGPAGDPVGAQSAGSA